ncbi:MAG: helix-turn-helix domain-containing protein [Niabella sp.]|nr:helix-turn-helix domain-containing protein [Niabella sp.]
MNNVVLTPIEPAKLIDSIADAVAAKLLASQPPNPDHPEFITAAKVAELFEVSLPTVHAWANAGILTRHKIGTRTFFKYKEVMLAVKPVIGHK